MSGQKHSASCEGGLAGILRLCKCRQSGYRTSSSVRGHNVLWRARLCRSVLGHDALATTIMDGPAVARRAHLRNLAKCMGASNKSICWMDHAVPCCNRLGSSRGGCLEPMPCNQGLGCTHLLQLQTHSVVAQLPQHGHHLPPAGHRPLVRHATQQHVGDTAEIWPPGNYRTSLRQGWRATRLVI